MKYKINFDIIDRFLALFIISVLAFSGISKIIDPSPSIELIQSVFKLSADLSVSLVTLISIAELTLASMMSFKKQQKAASKIITGLFLLFFVFSVYGILVGINEDCGCFGSIFQSKFDLSMIIRNFVLTSSAFYISRKTKFNF